MRTITITFTEQEAIAVKFVLNGARDSIRSEPRFVAPLIEAIGKVEAAIAAPDEPANTAGLPLEVPPET